jgi:hypothetical protein
MADNLPKTSQQAENLIRDKIRENYALYEQANRSGDKSLQKQYSNELDRLNSMLRATARINVGGVNIPIGAIGSALQSGISGLFTAIPDIATAGYNLCTLKITFNN